ncbi:MAG: ABC transporter permease subunit [Lachnospiraceae bacterium]|nr:ABC transporter permease subunit [Lachnospiraceae bacterium]
MSLIDKLCKILIQGGSWKTILGGLWVTIQILFFALLLGTALGALVCLLRTRKNPVLRGIASVYIAILRGTPVLMLLPDTIRIFVREHGADFVRRFFHEVFFGV